MLLKILFLTVGAYLMGNSLVLSFIMNFNTGIVLCFLLGTAMFFYGIYFDKINELTKKSFLLWLKRAIYAGIVFVILTLSFVGVYGKIDNSTYDEDVLIVLGSAVHGTEVSKPLKYRLDKALDYLEKNPDAFIVVTGSKGNQEQVSEAYAMEQYLIKRGVSPTKIIKEEKATSTYENFKYSKSILDKNFDGEYKTVFITNGFHIYRATQLSKYADISSNHIHCEMDWYTAGVHYLREFLAIIKLWIFKV